MKPGGVLLRWRRSAAGGLFALLLSGCTVSAGAPASDSSWSSETEKALGSAISSLGTARLILDNRIKGRLPSRYVAVALRDALRVLETETSGYMAAQPPGAKASDNAAAVAAIQDSVKVLSHAAVAGTSTPKERQAAVEALDAERKLVEKLRKKLVG